MVRSVKILRIVLPVLFVAFIALLAFSFTRGNRRPRAVAEPVTSTIRQDDSPQLVAYAFEDVQTIGGRMVSRIRARRTIGFSSGWYTLEDVHLTIYQENGDTYELQAPQAQFHADTKEAEAKGGVLVRSSDGVEIETAAIDFDGSRLVNEVPVRFRADAWEGKAGSVDLNLASEHLRLSGGVEATRSAAGGPPITIRSNTADFDRIAHEVVFRDDVVVERAGDRLTTETITARVDPERKILTGLEGCCGVRFALAPGSALAPQSAAGGTTVSGERFFTEVGPAGEVRAIFVEGGETPATATMAGPPQRILRAGQFRVALGERGVSELEARGSASIEEKGATPRTVTGSRMVAYFDPARQRATSALVEGNLEYRDPRNRATAQKGTFDFLTDRVILTAVPGVLPTIETDGQRLSAQQIVVHPRTGILEAEGFVKGRFVTAGGKSSLEQSGMFPGGRSPVHVNANELVLMQKDESAVFSGNVRAWQDDNIILAREMRIGQGGETLTARGEVRAVLYNARDRESGAPIKASGDTLTVDRSERRAQLEGSVRIEDQGRVLTAERATFVFDAQQELERVVAEEDVEVVERAAKRTGSGDRVVYHVPKRTIHLEGSPATVSDPQGTVKGKEIVFDMARNRVEVLRGEGQTEATYRPEGTP
ncbi:MAG: LptA/OstA family protein [Thermoanaerobaculia bacterium]